MNVVEMNVGEADAVKMNVGEADAVKMNVGEADAVKMNIGETDILPIMHRFQVLRHEIVGGKAFHAHVAVPFSGLKRLLVLLGARMPHSIRHRTDEPHGTRHLDGHEEIDSQLEHRHWVRRRVGFERVLKLEIRLLVHKTTVAYCTPIPTDGDGMIPRVERVRHQEDLQCVHVEDVPPPIRKGDGIVVGHVKGYGLANVFPYDGKPWRRVDGPHQKIFFFILCVFFGTKNTHTARNTHTQMPKRGAAVRVGNEAYLWEGRSKVYTGRITKIVFKLKRPDEIHSVETTHTVSYMINRHAVHAPLVLVSTPSGWRSFFNPGVPRRTLYHIEA
jgi:hypothetical protein